MVKIVLKKGIEVDGKVVVPYEYDELIPVTFNDGRQSEEFFKTVKDDINGLLILTNNSSDYIVYNGLYDITYAGVKSFIVTAYDERHGEKYALLDSELNNITRFEYDLIEPIKEGWFKTKKAGLSGIVREDGQVVIDNDLIDMKTEIDEESGKILITCKI